MKKNTVSQRQFRGPAPQQPVDSDNRAYKTEPNAPSKRIVKISSRKRVK